MKYLAHFPAATLKIFPSVNVVICFSQKTAYIKIELRKLLTLRKTELSNILLKERCLIFPETETSKKVFIFRETELSYASGLGNFKKFLYFRS